MWNTLYDAAKKFIKKITQGTSSTSGISQDVLDNARASSLGYVNTFLQATDLSEEELNRTYWAFVYTFDNDGEACNVCRSKNGSMFRVGYDGTEIAGRRFSTPPVHPNCDCTLRFMSNVPKQRNYRIIRRDDPRYPQRNLLENVEVPGSIGVDINVSIRERNNLLPVVLGLGAATYVAIELSDEDAEVLEESLTEEDIKGNKSANPKPKSQLKKHSLLKSATKSMKKG